MIIDNLSEAQYGDVILFEPTSLKGRIQVKIDNLGHKVKHNFSHGAIFWGFEGKTPLMLESVSPCGVHIAKVQEWRNYVIVRILQHEDCELRPKKEMVAYLNSKYDYSKLYAITLNRLFNVPLTVDDDSQVICTELINLAYDYKLTAKGMCTPIALANAIL
jgi:hypothetical protein